MKIIATTLLALIMGSAGQAYASCAFMPDPNGKMPWENDKIVTVSDHWAVRHVNDGIVSGCLAEFQLSGGKGSFTAYTAYDFICGLPADEKITVRQNFACCDTGEQGDYVCGIKTINPLAMKGQTSIAVVPAQPDRRAIPDMMQRLEKTEWIGAKNIAERLGDYAAVPELKAEVAALVPRLRALMASAGRDEKKAAIAQLLLRLDAGAADQAGNLDLALKILAGVNFGHFGADESQALAIVQQHPEAGEKIVPVLIDLFRRTRYQAESGTLLLQALPAFGTALQPHLVALHSILNDDLFEEASVEAAIADYDKFDYFKANNRDRNNADEVKRYQAMRESQRKDLEAKAQRSQTTMPLWQATVCAAFPLPAGIETRRVTWDAYDRIAPVTCPVKPR